MLCVCFYNTCVLYLFWFMTTAVSGVCEKLCTCLHKHVLYFTLLKSPKFYILMFQNCNFSIIYKNNYNGKITIYLLLLLISFLAGAVVVPYPEPLPKNCEVTHNFLNNYLEIKLWYRLIRILRNSALSLSFLVQSNKLFIFFFFKLCRTSLC